MSKPALERYKTTIKSLCTSSDSGKKGKTLIDGGTRDKKAGIYSLKNEDLSEDTCNKKVWKEVDKIWALYDLDKNGTLDYDEMKEYIQKTAFKWMNLSDRQVKEIYQNIDRDLNGTVDKEEMAQFLKILLSQLQTRIRENKKN